MAQTPRGVSEVWRAPPGPGVLPIAEGRGSHRQEAGHWELECECEMEPGSWSRSALALSSLVLLASRGLPRRLSPTNPQNHLLAFSILEERREVEAPFSLQLFS